MSDARHRRLSRTGHRPARPRRQAGGRPDARAAERVDHAARQPAASATLCSAAATSRSPSPTSATSTRSRVLYNATRLGHRVDPAARHGSLDLSLQASTLSLHNIRYFNRGVQARSSSIEINDVWPIPHSRVFGYVVGSARPLKDLKLPLLADVDQIMGVLQQDLTTVKLDGPLEHGGHAEASSPSAKRAMRAETIYCRGSARRRRGKK